MTEFLHDGRNMYGLDFIRESKLAIDDAPSGAVLDLRLKYVESMGWLKPGRVSDRDRYDEDGVGTVHISHRGAGSEVVAAMRLTPVDDFEDSLSFREMIGSDRQYQESVRRHLANHSTEQPASVQTWDLTRLVHDTSVERSGQLLPAFLGMFGAGLATTAPRDGSSVETRWVFITTDQIRRTLDVCGIEYYDLGQSSASSTEEISYCCLVKPVEAMSKLQANPRKTAAYKMVNSGFDEVVGIE